MKRFLGIFFALVSLVVLFGCRAEPPASTLDPIVGSWVDEYNMLKFDFSDELYDAYPPSSSEKKCKVYMIAGNSEILIENFLYEITGNSTYEFSAPYGCDLYDYDFYFTLQDSTLYCLSSFYEENLGVSEVKFYKR